MTVKKAELHTHLEGTITPALAKKIAQRNKLTLPPNLLSPDEQSYLYPDFPGFLKAYDAVAGVIKKPEDYYDITFDYLKNNALHDTLYVEMMYSPLHAEQASGIPSSVHLEAISAAIKAAEQQFQIIGRIIITAVRHFGAESAIVVAKQALKESAPYIVGFGLGGDEIHYPPRLFAKAYEIAASGGLSCTVHAGEFSDASGMLEAIEYLPIKRIGHGVQAIHCQETLAQLKDKNIALEICPSSNIALGLYPDMDAHPLKQLLEAGITISLGSDDPPFFRTTLATEYQRVQDAYLFSDAKMQEFTAMAIASSFAEEAIKKKLSQTLLN
ncbi:MAG: adenosine deaminase [Tatlockia sp.]|jgi:adenosine deaminase